MKQILHTFSANFKHQKFCREKKIFCRNIFFSETFLSFFYNLSNSLNLLIFWLIIHDILSRKFQFQSIHESVFINF